MKLVIDMPWEKNLSVNHMRYGAGGHYRKKPEVQAWMEQLKSLTWWRCYYPEGKEPFSQTFEIPIRIVVDFRFPSARRTDDHNYYKGIADAVAAGLGIDDKDLRISTGTVEIDRANPGFTITVEDER